jgi:hypothetical protein
MDLQHPDHAHRFFLRTAHQFSSIKPYISGFSIHIQIREAYLLYLSVSLPVPVPHSAGYLQKFHRQFQAFAVSILSRDDLRTDPDRICDALVLSKPDKSQLF